MGLDTNRAERPRVERPGSVIGIVVADFHAELTGAMADSAERELIECGVDEDDILRVHVPGAFEIPIVASRLAESAEVDAVLCFGLILKGETDHDRHVAEGCVQGIMRASLDAGVPIHFGVLTCATMEQARARALPPELDESEGAMLGDAIRAVARREDVRRTDVRRTDKGREVARAAIETLLALDEVLELTK